jgi:23S rRNA pseudouridine955/2504/2580 synthase
MSRAPTQGVEVAISHSLADSRVDRVLRRLLPGVPLSRIHRMLRKGDVRRGTERLEGPERTVAGDVLTLLLAPGDAAELRARLAGGPAPEVAAEATLSLVVLYEDEHIMALDKPSGVACHPGSSHPLEKTVLGALLALTAGECTATFRPSLVGRLDRDASGVQLAGRSPPGLRGLEALSRAQEIKKTYLVLARCRTLPDSGRVDLPLVDGGSGRARMVVAPPACRGRDACLRADTHRQADRGAGKGGTVPAAQAVTDYRVLGRAGGASLVEVEPATGRRHQIRAHFAHLGAHLAGDVRYGDRAWNAEIGKRAGLDRLFLHCARASFSHPLTGAATTVCSPLPSDLTSALTKLGISLPESYNP